MEMKMKMKDNKMLLALTLVAALALCSVAAVAVSDSEAAGTVLINEDLTIDKDTDGASLNVYAGYYYVGTLEETSITLTITPDAKYTGLIQFGTYDKNTEKYIPAITLDLKGVSGMTVTFTANVTVDDTDKDFISDVAVIETVPGTNSLDSTTGTITLTKGSVRMGSSGYFTGEISTDGAKFTSSNTKGAVVSAAGEISGTITAGSQQEKVKTDAYYTSATKVVEPTFTVDGKATVGELTLGTTSGSYSAYPSNGSTTDNVDFVITSGSDVTLSANAQTYKINSSVSSGKALSIFIGSGSGSGNAALYDEYGVEVACAIFNDGNATFKLDNGMKIDMGKKYTLMANVIESDGFYIYIGNVSFSVAKNGDYTEAKMTLSQCLSVDKATMSDGSVVGESAIAKTLSDDNKTISYNKEVYNVILASINDEDVTFTGVSVKDGTITGKSNIATSGNVIILLQNKSTEGYVVYYGNLDDVHNLKAPASIVKLTPGTFTAAAEKGKIQSGKVVADLIKTGGTDTTDANADLAADNVTTGITNNKSSKIAVDGTLNVLYGNDKSNGSIVNSGIIDVNGTIMYQTAKGTDYTAPVSSTINAAAYKVSAASTSTQTYDTYYYTTLDNAMKAAVDVYIYGTVKVLKDTELTGTPVGTASSKNKITITQGSTLEIGQKKTDAKAAEPAKPAMPAEESIVVIVTVPGTTKLVTDGTVAVSNGQLKIAGLKTDLDYNVTADVFMTDASHGIYTDLATALGLAVSGDVVKVRNQAATDVQLSKDASVIAGVELNATGHNISVPGGITFTVSGIIKVEKVDVQRSVTTPYTPGKLILNTYNKDSKIDTVDLAGVLTFSESYDNTASDANKFTATLNITGTVAAPAEVDVLGKIVFKGTVGASQKSENYVSFSVSGSMDSDVTSGTHIDTLGSSLTVSGTYKASSDITFDNVTVTGKIVCATGKTFGVNDKIVVGSPVTDLKNTANTAEVTFYFNVGDAYAIVYGTPADGKVVITDNTGKKAMDYKTVMYFGNVIYATQYAKGADSVALDVVQPVIGGQAFSGWFDAPSNGNAVTVNSGNKIGVGAESGLGAVYGMTKIMTFSVTFNHVQNATWTINGQVVDGISTVQYSPNGYTIALTADNGFEIKNVSILVNNKAMTAGYVPADGDVVTISSTTVVEAVAEEDSGMGITEILLIVITIMVVVMAIIIALKLMRS